MKHKCLRRIVSWILAAALAVSPGMQITGYAKEQYREGIYIGEAVDGFKGDPVTITLKLETKEGKTQITEASAEREFLYSTEKSKRFWQKAQALLETIKEKNSVEGIDAVSGATYSSKAILEAAGNALEKAKTADLFDGGDGSLEHPYEIADKESLLAFAKTVGQTQLVSGNEVVTDYAGKYIELTADIDLTGESWMPVGTKAAPFAGNFDGKNHTIKGMTIGSDEAPADIQYAGFFGYASGDATLANIRLTQAQIDTDVASSKNTSAGVLLGSGDSVFDETYNAVGGTKISHCYVSGRMNIMTEDKKANVGGMAGLLNQCSM